jgi:hypothetical protein
MNNKSRVCIVAWSCSQPGSSLSLKVDTRPTAHVAGSRQAALTLVEIVHLK